MSSPSLFIGIGAQRAGTSWLFHCLKNHPDVFMPQKEVHFFDKKYEQGEQWYTNLFEQNPGKPVQGEITPEYMSSTAYMERIRAYKDDVKLLIILRNPLQRSVSAYNLYRSYGDFKDKSFAQAIKSDPKIINKSLYFQQVSWVLEHFDRKNVFVGLYDDIEQNSSAFVKSVYRFLEVDENYVPVAINERKNISAASGMQSWINLPKIQSALIGSPFRHLFYRLKATRLAQSLKRYLVNNAQQKTQKIRFPDEYREQVLQDIDKLSGLLDRDLNKWKQSV